MFKKLSSFFLALLLGVLLAPDLGHAAGSTLPCTLGTNCTGSGGAIVQNTAGTGAWPALRSSAGVTGATSNLPIDAYGYCRFVDNPSGSSYLIPFNSEKEWTSIITSGTSGDMKYNAATNRGIQMKRCTRPVNGSNLQLQIGPSEVRYGMGDSGPQYNNISGSGSLGYSRVLGDGGVCGTVSGTITDNCYQEVSNPVCWHTHQECKTDCDPDVCVDHHDCSWGCDFWIAFFFGICVPVETCNDYRTCSPGQCRTSCWDVCDNWGSQCGQNWTSWTENWTVQVCPTTSPDITEPNYGFSGWAWQSPQHISGHRPSQCDIRCEFNGHDCCCPGPCPAPKVTPSVTQCNIPGQTGPDWACYMFYASMNGGATISVAIVMIFIQQYEDAVNAAVANNDCAAATAARNDENNMINWANTTCQSWASQALGGP